MKYNRRFVSIFIIRSGCFALSALAALQIANILNISDESDLFFLLLVIGSLPAAVANLALRSFFMQSLQSIASDKNKIAINIFTMEIIKRNLHRKVFLIWVTLFALGLSLHESELLFILLTLSNMLVLLQAEYIGCAFNASKIFNRIEISEFIRLFVYNSLLALNFINYDGSFAFAFTAYSSSLFVYYIILISLVPWKVSSLDFGQSKEIPLFKFKVFLSAGVPSVSNLILAALALSAGEGIFSIISYLQRFFAPLQILIKSINTVLLPTIIATVRSNHNRLAWVLTKKIHFKVFTCYGFSMFLAGNVLYFFASKFLMNLNISYPLLIINSICLYFICQSSLSINGMFLMACELQKQINTLRITMLVSLLLCFLWSRFFESSEQIYVIALIFPVILGILLSLIQIIMYLRRPHELI